MDVCCAICKESVTSDDISDDDECGKNPLITTKCGHIYHLCCFGQWLKFKWNSGHGTCPTCRQKTDLSECVTLYPAFQETTEANLDESRFQRIMKGIIELENRHDPDLKQNHLAHTMVTIFIWYLSIGIFCEYINILIDSVDNMKFSEDFDDILLENNSYRESVIPFGYPFINTMLATSFSSILFAYWRVYMAQNKISWFVFYLWYCLKP